MKINLNDILDNIYGGVYYVTMSFGATKISKNDKIESLTKRADNNMYGSKKQGKNFITVT